MPRKDQPSRVGDFVGNCVKKFREAFFPLSRRKKKKTQVIVTLPSSHEA